MNQDYYCVFWYPTIFHQEKIHRNSNDSSSFVEISDKDTTKNLYLKVEEKAIEDKPGCYHLTFTLTNNKSGDIKAKTINCTFSYFAHTRNGFVIYTYDRDALKQNYWNVFLNSERERRKSIEKLKARLHDRIIEKYGEASSSGKDALPSDELVKDYVVDRILISFYHHAKGFYHEHEVQSQSDGKLKAYYYSKEHSDGHRKYLTKAPTLSTKNNEVINWYLDQFEHQFIGYAEEISKQHREFTKRIDLRRRSRNALTSTLPNAHDEIQKCLIEYRSIQKEPIKRTGNTPPTILSLLNAARHDVENLSPEKQKQELQKLTDCTSETEIKEIKELHAKLRVLSKLCGDALTEYTYCKALLGSKYNDDYKHDKYFNQRQVGVLSLYSDFFPNLSTLDDRRKKAFNIRNSIRYIEGVKQNCSRWENELTENLIEHVHNISQNHKATLATIGDLISKIKFLSENHKKSLGTIKKLSHKATDLSEENKKMLKESEKSNLYSSFLGSISVSLGLISVGLAFWTIEKTCKWVAYFCIAAGAIIAIVKYAKYIIRKRRIN